MRVNTVYGWITACISCDHTVMLALLLILILSLGQDCNHISGLIFVEKHVTDDNLPSVLSKTSQPRYVWTQPPKKEVLPAHAQGMTLVKPALSDVKPTQEDTVCILRSNFEDILCTAHSIPKL